MQLRLSHTRSRENVLPTVADSGVVDPETREPGAAANPRYVHGTLSDRVLPRAQALYNLQPRVPCRRLPHLLQWDRQLFTLEHKLRYSKMRQRLRQPIMFNSIIFRELSSCRFFFSLCMHVRIHKRVHRFLSALVSSLSLFSSPLFFSPLFLAS